jgi:hypothetical protein
MRVALVLALLAGCSMDAPLRPLDAHEVDAPLADLLADLPADFPADAGLDADPGAEAGADVPHPVAGIGNPCSLDTDCPQGFCAVNFPGGYCTLACDDGTCPDFAYCGFTNPGHFCYAACSIDGTPPGPGIPETCRAGYQCATTGKPHCVPAGNVEIGGNCVNGGQCQSGVCIHALCDKVACPAGVCSKACGQGGSCPSGTLCTQFESHGYCVRPCTTVAECLAEQKCRPGEPKWFCAP